MPSVKSAQPARPRLRPQVRVLRRSADAVQVGDGASEGIVLEGLTPAECHFLESLDSQAAAGGVPAPASAASLLRLLSARDLITTAPPVRAGRARRNAPRITVEGSAAVISPLRVALTQAGYRLTAYQDRRRLRGTDLAVLAGHGALAAGADQPWREHRIRCLPVVIDGPRITIGPLLDPQGPCLKCLDLVRCDHDPAWPVLLAQIAAREPLAERTADTVARATLAAALTLPAIGQLTGHDTGSPPDLTGSGTIWAGEGTAVSATWRLPDLTIARHAWQIHPLCPDHPGSATLKE